MTIEKKSSTIKNDLWVMPIGEPDASLKNRTSEDIETWKKLVTRVIEVAKPLGLSKAEVGRRTEMPDGTFNQWFSGSYNGNLAAQNKKIAAWLDQNDEIEGLNKLIPVKPPFQMTRIAMDITNTLALAQATGDMVMITIGAGNGKTEACRNYAKTRPNVSLVTASPHTKTPHSMLVDMAICLKVIETNPARLKHAIGERLQKIGDGTLLIIDEAQHLNDDAINQLRHFVDIYGTGLALVGNDEVYGRLARQKEGPSYAQIKSRLGKRLKRDKPYPEDIAMRIEAWGIYEPEAIKYLTGLGLKAGALRQIDKTMVLAKIIATGEGEEVGRKHIKAAWENRDVEAMI